jgi:holo-[acyl-carrier protein] synthase
MIIGTGIDIIEINRIKTALARPGFAERLFTEKERAYCEGRGVQRFASYAARFAGKEAVLKALGTGLSGGAWLEIEILPDAKGAPKISFSGRFASIAREKGITQSCLSLTHAREYAAAQVILWGGEFDESGKS